MRGMNGGITRKRGVKPSSAVYTVYTRHVNLQPFNNASHYIYATVI